MTQDEKLQSLKDWLTKHKIDFNVNDDKEIDARIVISKPQRIAVFVCAPEQEDLNFGAASMAKHKPFFIRETDTEDFVIGKMKNALRGWNIAKVKKEEEKKRKAEAKAEVAKPKRKRVRVRIPAKPTYERVSPKRK